LAFGLAPEATPARSGDRPIRPRDQQGQPGMGCSERRHGQGDVRRVRSRGRRGHPRAGDRWRRPLVSADAPERALV